MSGRPKHPPCPTCGKALYKSLQPAAVKPSDPWDFCRNKGCPTYGKRQADIKPFRIVDHTESTPPGAIRVIVDVEHFACGESHEEHAETMLSALSRLKGYICGFVAWPGCFGKDGWTARAYFRGSGSAAPVSRQGIRVKWVPLAEADPEKAAKMDQLRAAWREEQIAARASQAVRPTPRSTQAPVVPPAPASGSETPTSAGPGPCGLCGEIGVGGRVHSSMTNSSQHLACCDLAEEARDICPAGCKGIRLGFSPKNVKKLVCPKCKVEVDSPEYFITFVRAKINGRRDRLPPRRDHPRQPHV